MVNASSVKLVYGSSSYEPSSFVGTTPSYLTAHSYKIQEGASFTSADVSQHKRVAVIGQTVVQELFAGQSAVGQNIKVNGSNYEVVGVLASKGSNGATNEDDVVMAPITTVQNSLTRHRADRLDHRPGQVRILARRRRIGGHADHRGTPQNQEHRRTGLQRAQPGIAAGNIELHEQRVHDTARRGRRDLAAGRRDRRHEHHARERHRAYARDRHPQGDRRQALRTSSPSS